jgi:hypothetical protein
MLKSAENFIRLNLIDKYGEKKVKYFVAIVVLGLLYVFYLSRNLFYVNGLNDFDEYFLRAQCWVNGEWNYGGGIDKLLSFIEYFGLKYNNKDFKAFYTTTNSILVSLQFIVILIFIIKPNKVLPNFSLKLLLSVFLLTMPYFAVKGLTIEESSLFSTMLIFFLTFYNNKYLGFLSLLVYLARPESIIIFPLYVLLWIIDTEKRKNILINFITFLVFFFVYKYIDKVFLNPAGDVLGAYNSISGYTDASGKGPDIVHMIKRVILAGLQLPIICFIYALEITQNYILFILFSIGFISSIFNKKMYVFYGILVFYIGTIFLMFGFQQFIDYGLVKKVLWPSIKMINNTIEITNGRNMEFNIYGHSRYRLPMYISIAAFIIAGLAFIVSFSRRKIRQNIPLNKNIKTNRIGGKRSKKISAQVSGNKNIAINKSSKVALLIEKLKNPFQLKETGLANVLFIALLSLLLIFHNLFTYSNFSTYYKYKNQMKDQWINTYYHFGFEIRKTMKPDDVVFMPNLCNCNLSFIIEFLVFSGNKYVMAPICENCTGLSVKGIKDKYQISAEEIQKISPSRIVFFDRYQIDAKKSFNDTSLVQITKLFSKFDLSMLDSLNIKYVITSQPLTKESLELITEIGESKLYRNTKIN